MAERYFAGKVHWNSILHAWLESYTIFAPQKEAGGLFLQPVTQKNSSSIVYDLARSVQPQKSFFSPPLEEITEDPEIFKKPWLFLGIKACDITALPILDKAFGGEFEDPKYTNRRRNSFIVTSDCTEPYETCFCTVLGGKPYPDAGFDINLSRVWDGFILEVGSSRGKKLLEGHDRTLKEVVKEEAETLEKIRTETIRKVQTINQKYGISGDLKDLVTPSWESDVWKRHAETCVECGACNHACPTCHCYFLDDVTRGKYVKLRGWDACQYSGYAVTAGGGTPRPKLFERFRNRYFCKFRYLKINYEQYGCTGCGRCIEGCQGKIDMREALSDLMKKQGQ